MNNATLIRAELVRVGDRVRFKDSRFDFTVEGISEGAAGIRFHFNDDAASNLFGHGELVWIERRAA